MRPTAVKSQTRSQLVLPRGWIVLFAALASWLVVAALWAGTSQLFGLVVAAL